ncbi:MAG: ABC transporter substrate-binding protein, partial [Gammaproteobacteria bacterium]|nr:ABC transporter substrate-binding protein [Gammaproteobacteria bacterium]
MARSGEDTDTPVSSGTPRSSHPLTRRSLLRSGFAALAAAPFAKPLAASASSIRRSRRNVVKQADDIVLGVSAAFSGPSRGLGTELYRGAMAWFSYVNDNGGVNGRRIVLKLYDDGYQPDTCVANTLRLMQEDDVFLLFGYVGTPTVTRVLPLLKRFSDRQVYLFFPFTGAEPQREPPYGEFAFNLRASYRQETAGLVDNFVRIGRRRVAVFYQIDAYGRSGWAGVREALARHGETIAGEATYTRGTPF